MSSSLNSSVPHFTLFSSAFSALLKSFSDEFFSCDFTIFVDKNIIELVRDDLVVYADEINTLLQTENFDIEVFESEAPHPRCLEVTLVACKH